MKQYCYTGDVKKLIPAGWTFQKLYARNYKTYHKGDVIMYVVSKMAVEISNLSYKDQVKLIDFIIQYKDKPYSFWVKPGHFGDIAAYVIQNHDLITWKEAIRRKAAWHRAYDEDEGIEYLEDGFYIRYEIVESIKQLMNLGRLSIKDVR